MPRNRALRILIYCLSILVFIGDVKAEAQPRKVRIGIPSPTIPMLAFYVAKDKGFYRQEDLEV